LHPTIGGDLCAGARCHFGHQDAIGQLAHTRFGFFLGEEFLLGLEGDLALRLGRILGVLCFVSCENLFDPFTRQRQWLALVGLLQTVDQGLELQVRDLLTQALAEAGSEAVGEVMGVVGFFFRRAMGERQDKTQRQQ